MTLEQTMGALGIPYPPANAQISSSGFVRYGKNNRYWFKKMEDVAMFGDWEAGSSHQWFEPSGIEEKIAARQGKFLQIRAERESEVAAAHELAALQCEENWKQCTDEGNIAYLQKKQIKPFGVRFHEGSLVVPLLDVEGKLWSLQYISAFGEKRFANGGKIRGHFHTIGKMVDSVFVVEGYATGASVYMATGTPVVVAFNAGNIGPVVQALKTKYPHMRIIIAADDDRWKSDKINVGKEKAEAVAEQYNCTAIFPLFKNEDLKPTDWNDLHVNEGLEIVEAQLQKATSLNRDLNSTLIQVSQLSDSAPLREWIVTDWIPRRSVTGLFGPGGSGKSLLAQQLGTVLSANFYSNDSKAVPSGNLAFPKNFWLGLYTFGARVIAYFCEDELDELHRRQNDINRELKIEVSKDTLESFYIQSRVGLQNLLMIFDKNGLGKPTDFYHQIVADLKHTNAEVVILDNVAQLFGGNENHRSEVTQFVNLLHKLALERDVTVVLLGHPAKGEASEYSGSTAWDACFRSRLYFSRPANNDDNPNDNADSRILVRSKANYSRIGDKVQMKWMSGAFQINIKTALSTGFARNEPNLEKVIEQKFLDLLDKFTSQGINVSHSPKAQNFAPKMMVQNKDNDGYSKQQYIGTMHRLFESEQIIANAKIGSHANRTAMRGIARKIPDSPICASSDEEILCVEVHNGNS